MSGILAVGAYVPHYRLDRKAVAQALDVAGGAGTRAVASYDENTTSLAVEAARSGGHRLRGAARGLYFATSDPGYLDKTNAATIHAALDLDPAVPAFDMVGSVRSAAGALRAALDARVPTLAVMADIRTGLPGGADERDGGDAAVAFLCGDGTKDQPVLAEPVATASRTSEFLDRWRLPGDNASRQWEERFGEHAYVPLGEAAVADALKQAGVTADALHAVIVAGPHGRANKRVAAAVGAKKAALVDDLTSVIGNTGAAHAGLLLADALEKAGPDQLLMVVSLADGADVTLWRTTAAITSHKPMRPVAQQAKEGAPVAYATFLTWRGFLKREPPRRPDPQAPESPAALRAEGWKYAFIGSKCQACGARHLPPQRVCVKCHAIDRMAAERMADVPARIATFTVDRLAFSLSPPVVVAVIDFDGGGRFQCEMTDVDPAAVKIGDRVEMTFRRLMTVGGVHNYFWKARPVRGA